MAEDKNVNINLSVGSGVVENTLENLVDKPSKSIGESFNDIWFLTLGGPLGQLAEKRRLRYAKDLDRYKKKIEERIEQVPPEKRCEADIQIIGSVLEASKYCAEKRELRDMFAELIASSINVDKKDKVHPIFIDIIKRMSALDAQVFRDLAGVEKIQVGLIDEEDMENIIFSIAALLQLGLIQKKQKLSGNKSFASTIIDFAVEIFTGIDFDEICEEAVEIADKIKITGEPFYVLFRNNFELSPLGNKFKEICL